MREIKNGKTCANCGASVTSEICPYCGSPTGLITSQADMEYPVIDCKEANIGFWTVTFPLIFAFSFGFFGFVFPFLFLNAGIETDDISFVFLICIPFAVIGFTAFIIALKPLIRYIKVKKHGKEITATVYGYTDDNILLNGVPAQVVKLLVSTPQGNRFIMYQLGNTSQPYGVNTKLNLLVYKDCFLIPKKREYLF